MHTIGEGRKGLTGGSLPDSFQEAFAVGLAPILHAYVGSVAQGHKLREWSHLERRLLEL